LHPIGRRHRVSARRFRRADANLNAFGSTLGITPDVSADVVRAKLNLHF
jgi:hypothetical protein